MPPKTPKKQRTTRKVSAKSPKSPKTPQKSSTLKTRIPRILPKSPISESMRQTTISDFFKPIIQSPNCTKNIDLQSIVLNEDITEIPQTSDRRTRSKDKVVKKLYPILSPQKALSECNKNKKKVKNKTKLIMKAEKYSQMSDIKDRDDIESDDNIRQFDSEINNNELLMNDQALNEIKNNFKTLDTIETNDVDSDDDLLVPVVRKSNNRCQKSDELKSKDKYADKEKQKLFNFCLNNLHKLERDKEILHLQSVNEIENDFLKVEESQVATNQSNYFCYHQSLKCINIFNEFINKQINRFLKTNSYKDVIKSNTRLYEMPLNRLICVMPLVSPNLSDSDLNSLIAHIIKLISCDQTVCPKNIDKSFDCLFENLSEIQLSVILVEFYQFLKEISKYLNPLSAEYSCSEIVIIKQCTKLSNVIQLVTQVLNKCCLKVDVINSEEELIELLVIAIAFTIDTRLMTNTQLILKIKDFILVLIKHLIVDTMNSTKIIDKLIAFCKSEKYIALSLQIIQLLPMNVNIEIKRQFCISFIKLYLTETLQNIDTDYTIGSLENILNQIDWKTLLPLDIYIITSMFSQLLDLPNDLFESKETILKVLNILCLKVRTCAKSEIDLELIETNQLLTILKAKINGSAKR